MQTDREAVFQTDRFEFIKSGDPFGKIKLTVEAPSSTELPETTTAEDRQIIRKLIESIDNTAENGHLYAIICENKAEIFPEQLQDRGFIKKWLLKHGDLFKMVQDVSGGVHSVVVLDKARRKNRRTLPSAATQKQASHSKTTPKKAKDDSDPVDLLKLADNIKDRISEKIKKAGGIIPFESLLKAKDIISLLCEEKALNTFLTKFPETFELIDLEGIGKWVHLKGADKKTDAVKDPVSEVTSFIFKNGGTVLFGNLVKEASALIGGIVNSPDDLLAWLSYNANNFEVIAKPDDPMKPWIVKVKFRIFPRFCQRYLTKGQCPQKECQFLHICKAYVCQRPHEFCNFSHDIRDAHNKTIIDRMGALNKETDTVVLNVLLKCCFPQVCVDYNKSGVCPRGDNCYFLHVCDSYVLNQCENLLCILSHNVIDGLHNINVLKRYALLPSQKLSVEIIKTNIAFARVQLPSIYVGMSKLPQHFERLFHGSKAGHYTAEVKATTSQSHRRDKRDRKEKRRHPRHGRMHSQLFSTADDGSSAETDSSGEDDDDVSIASSNHSAEPSLLSSENIRKSILATPLSDAQKHANWMGNHEHVPIQLRTRSDSMSSSEISYVSNQSSVVSSQSSIWQDDLEKKVFIAVLKKYNGEAPFKKISKDKELFGNDVDVVKWFENHSKMFILNRNGQGKMDSVSAFAVKARICLDYNERRGCDKPMCGFLHLCRNHIETGCPKGKACSRNHDVTSDQVSQTVKRMGLPDLSPDQLVTLIRFSVPTVCHFYNQGPCNQGEFCPNLHVCKDFIKGHRFCKASPCKFGHEEALRKGPAVKLLKMYRLYGKQPNFKYIRKMIFELRRPSSVKEQSDGVQRQVSDEPRHVDLTMKVDNQEKESEEVVPNICVQSLIDQCRIKKCPDIHFPVPYCWQFKLLHTAGSWHSFNTNDCEMVEKYFCDVNCPATELNISTTITADVSSVRLDFQSMSGHPQPATGESFKIRRLQCEQSGNKHDDETWYETKWLWYELKSSKWIKYDTAEANVYEKLYSKGSLPVDWSTQRRRPASFLTKSEAKKIKRSAKEQQTLDSATTPPPQSSVSSQPLPQSLVSSQPPQPRSYPVREDIQSSQEPHRTRVEPGTLEYKEIEGLLVDSTGQNTLVVNHIDKIVSDGLWEKYKGKKKSMTDDLRPGEKLNEKSVFIPCLHEDLQRIMKGNVGDSRIILPEPLGRGYYFTSDASFCVESCREHFNLAHSQFYLIVCQVLLGTCTQGAQGLTEFPRRADGRFYDSLVDNKDDPTVFVIKNIEQCYPAFVIGFYTATPSNEGLANVSESPIFPQPNYPPVPPAYQEVSHDSRPLSQGYVPPSSTTTPSPPPAYVKAVPVNSGISPTISDPPPYTPYPSQPTTRAASGEQPGNVRPVIPSVVIPNTRSTARRPGDPKDKCVVM